MGEPHERTLKQLAKSYMTHQPLCVIYLDTMVSFELKPGLIHLLPQFKGSPGKDPHKHLKDFHFVCDGMRPHKVTEDQLNLRAFPFSLKEAAKDWFYYQPLGSITTWIRLKKQFPDKFFPSSHANSIRKEIYGIT